MARKWSLEASKNALVFLTLHRQLDILPHLEHAPECDAADELEEPEVARGESALGLDEDDGHACVSAVNPRVRGRNGRGTHLVLLEGYLYTDFTGDDFVLGRFEAECGAVL